MRLRNMAATLGLLVLTAASAASAATVDGLTLGPIEPVEPDDQPRGLVFLFSGEDGLTPELRTAADRLARDLDVIVAPVALLGFLERQSALPRQCLYLVSDIEEASQRIQAGRQRYLTPIPAGTGMGAAVAYAALAQAPDATLDGSASDGFSTRVGTTKPLCPGAASTPAETGGFTYAAALLPGWWRVAPAPNQRADASTFVTQIGAEAAAIVDVPPGAGLVERLELLLRPPLDAAANATKTLAELPIVELPVAGKGDRMAVVYSGDGGWRDIDKDIAGRLQEKGVPVVGVDSLRYFWSERTPERVAADLDLLIDHYRDAWQRPEVILIGYSFGADVLPFAYNRLQPEHRRSVERLALLGLASTADMVIRVAGWLGFQGGGRPTAPELERLPHGLVQCFYGREEEDTACTSPALKGAELVRTAGGHHFDGDYAALADKILDGATKP